jgi:hypothetical protein
VDLALRLVRERLSGEGYKLRIVTVWDDDLLVGIMPLMLEHQWDFDMLLFVGTGLPGNPDLFARGGWKDRVLAPLYKSLDTAQWMKSAVDKYRILRATRSRDEERRL